MIVTSFLSLVQCSFQGVFLLGCLPSVGGSVCRRIRQTPSLDQKRQVVRILLEFFFVETYKRPLNVHKKHISKLKYKDIYRRTIKILQCTHGFKANYVLKVHNVQLNLAYCRIIVFILQEKLIKLTTKFITDRFKANYKWKPASKLSLFRLHLHSLQTQNVLLSWVLEIILLISLPFHTL